MRICSVVEVDVRIAVLAFEVSVDIVAEGRLC
jgi:hypothetical protein